MKRKSFSNSLFGKLEAILYIVAIILIILSIWIIISFPTLHPFASFPILAIAFALLFIICWRIVAKKYDIKKDRKKVPGKAFEMMFFLFLFMANYCISFMLTHYQTEIMFIGFIFFIIGASYCGYLHYFKGMYDDKYECSYPSSNKFFHGFSSGSIFSWKYLVDKGHEEE